MNLQGVATLLAAVFAASLPVADRSLSRQIGLDHAAFQLQVESYG